VPSNNPVWADRLDARLGTVRQHGSRADRPRARVSEVGKVEGIDVA
jgi:hypothetical protein